MFNVIFEAFSAFNQLGFLFGGLICLGLALLIILAEVQTRARSARVQGRIVAVRCGGAVSGTKNPPENKATAAPQSSFREAFKKDPATGTVGLLFAAIVILVPLSLFAGGVYFAWDYLHLKSTGVMTQAKVVRIEENRGGDGTTYSVIAAFTDKQGKAWQEKDRIGTGSRGPWKPRSSIKIFYDYRNPAHFVIDDFWHNMALPFALMGISGAALFFIFGLPSLRRRIKRQPSDAQEKSGIGMMEAAGRYYYPVYEYTAPNGETVRAHSTSGSNSLGDKIVGTPVTLLVNPDEPWSANPPNIKLIAVLVLFLMIPATLFLYTAFANFAFNIFSVIFSIGLLAYFGVKIARSIKPRDQWEKPSEFKQRRRERRRKKMENPGGGYILSQEEFNERLRAIDRYTLILTPFMALVAAGLLAGGHYLARDMQEFSARARATQGEVVRLESQRSGDSYAYYPVVEFNAGEKKTRFQDRFGSNPAGYTVGEKVGVLYDPASPTRAKIDHGILNNLPAAACYGFGGLLLWWTLKCLWNIRRRREG